MSLKLLGKNTAIYAVGNVGARAAAFLLIPLYAHALSVSDFGLLATLQITIQIMAILTSGGMRNTLLRFVKEYETQGKLGVLLGTSILINILGGLIVGAISYLFLAPVFRQILHIQNVMPYIGLTCCAALAQSLSAHITSYYRAQHQAIRYLISGVLTAVLIFAATYILISIYKFGVIGALIAFTAAHLMIVLVVSVDIFRKTGVSFSYPSMISLLHFGFPLVFSMSSELAIGAMGVYLLSYFAGLEAVAIYSLGYKLAQILIITTLAPFASAFQPYVFSDLDRLDQKERIARSFTYLIFAVVLMSLCLITATKIMLPFIAPPEYASAYTVVLLLIPGMTFVGIYYFGETLMTAAKKTRSIGLTATVIAAASLIMNFVLIRKFDWLGAVIALDASFIMLGLALTASGMKRFPIPLEWGRIAVLTGLLIAFLTAMYVLRDLPVISFAVTSVLMGILGVLLLLNYNFFHEDEKLAVVHIRSIFARKYC